ncbi:MAG: enoyl-CoA hydratase [Acidimicrobiaceae bacterium]|nr:enoyl-CoA hydratase [Acidimicrobiaceae bacterium]
MRTTRMHNDTVSLGIDSATATVTLDRPDSLNSMSIGLCHDLIEAIETAESDRSVAVVIITGAGRGFCAGADLSQPALGAGAANEEPVDVPTLMDLYFNPAVRAIQACSVPTVARVNGIAGGGGFGLALACDIAIAARSASFVATFGPKLGIVPDIGTTWHLSRRAGRSRALGIALLGERISAAQAVEWGLIYAVVDDDALDHETARVAKILRDSSAEASIRIRDAIDVAPHHSFSEHLNVEREHQRVLAPLNLDEGIRAFLEKRSPEFPGR